ncbi:MAG: FAD-dependent oxidoreductase [Proteobacteria bacterium]|nr:FAD-dependent oxidoreductase [Pseudomonadota bacterium]
MSGLDGMRVVIAGAGALGSCLAFALARAGAAVTVVDPAPDASASAVAAGMIAPVFESVLDPETAIGFDLLRRAAGLWEGLAAELGVPLDRSGSLAVGGPDDLDRWTELAATIGAPARRLGRTEAERLTPGLTAPSGALFADIDVRIDPRAMLAALAGAIAARRSKVVGWSAGVAHLSDGERLAADRLVIATGAALDLAGAAPELGVLQPIKGHILRASGGPSAGAVVRMVRGYVCPSRAGAVIGASMEFGRADRDVEPDVVRRLADQAGAAFPGLELVSVEAQVGVRAATPDGLPLAGPSRTPDVWIAGGARRNGWLLAPLIAEALASALRGDREPALPAAFDPRRYG